MAAAPHRVRCTRARPAPVEAAESGRNQHPVGTPLVRWDVMKAEAKAKKLAAKEAAQANANTQKELI